MKKLFFAVFIFFLAGAVCSWAFYPWLLTATANYFIINNPTRGADAIVVLSGGVTTRLPRAYKLYLQGYASRILLTEGREFQDRFDDILCDERDNAQALITFWGIGDAVTRVPSLKGGATSTFDEAYDLLAYCRKKNFKHIFKKETSLMIWLGFFVKNET